MSEAITIVLVEDHFLTRAGLRTALEAAGGLRIAGEAGDGISAEGVIVTVKPNVG